MICPLLLLLAQGGLLAWSARCHSPSGDEVGHLAAGLHHWRTGRFDLYRVNPPFVRLVATAPLALFGVELPHADIDPSPLARAEFALGQRFIDAYGQRSFWYVTVARWACVPFALLATLTIFAWTTELYGRPAGLLVAFLWVVSPTALGNGQMITPDTGAAALGLAACYLFRRWLRQPTWAGSLNAGVALGLAELCKTTWVLLLPVWVISWVAYRTCPAGPGPTGPRPRWTQLAAALTVTLYLLNAGYGFEGSGELLGNYAFVSRTLTVRLPSGERVNRFAGTWAAGLPVPLPRNYVQGIDVQKRDFESGMRSYLRGEWRTEGWWYYYLYGLAVKTPLGTLLVLVLAAATYLGRGGRAPAWQDEFVLLLPAMVVLAFVSSQTGFNHHLRYVLPALPFVFVWSGRALLISTRFGRCWMLAVAVAAVAAAISSLAVYPHSLSYFDEVAGGPQRGSEHLVDSNIDWGQDLLHLRDWLEARPDARPLGLAYYGPVDPRHAGIDYRLPPRGPLTGAELLPPRCDGLGPRPGWYAVSVNLLRGVHFPVSDGAGGEENVDGPWYAYFQRCRPVALVGYSIFVYHLDEEECDRVREELGLPRGIGR